MEARDATRRLTETGDHHLRGRRFEEAIAAYRKAAGTSDVPAPELCSKLARALAELGENREAVEWALRLVDVEAGFTAWTAAARLLRRCGADGIPRLRRSLRVAVVGTWTTNAFVPLLELAAARLGLHLDVYEAPFGQYFQALHAPDSELYAAEPEALILSPDHRALGVPAYVDDPEALIEAEVARWSSVWASARAVRPVVIVQHGFALPVTGGFGHFGSGLEGSWGSVAGEVDRRLAHAGHAQDVGRVDVDALAAHFGKHAWFDDRHWHVAKVALSPQAMPTLARHTAAVLAARLGLSRRCLVLDLDQTLWGGEIGDDGLEGLTLGEGPDGEAFVDFQRAVKACKERGVTLAVCSKNDAAVAREPFESHPEMVLRLDDFAAFVANWSPKSENLREIARRLDLGLDALTFVDDNPYEREQVRQALPDVDVIALPEDPAGYRRALEAYPYFELANFTREDRARTEQYRARAQAEALRAEATSLEDYQASLGMVATLGPIDQINMARVVQLIQKTNQFNLTLRRRQRDEIEALIARPDVVHLWVRLRDRFAHHGLIAVAIGMVEGRALEIDTLLMSCRVLGREVEQVIVRELADRARALGLSELVGRYVPAARNGLVADLYPSLGFEKLGEEAGATTLWTHSLADGNAAPLPIEVERAGDPPSVATRVDAPKETDGHR